MPPPSIDVLVVGAGPTGLMAASQLVARGVSCRIIDKLSAPDLKSRALVVQARSLELLAKVGLADRLVTVGHKGLRGSVYVKKQRIVSVEIGDRSEKSDTPFPFALFVSQAETERVLTEHLRALGGRIERGVELAGFTQDEEGVNAELKHGEGRTETVRARYIVGCDGAHSRVRHQAGISFKGDAYPQEFVLGDVEIDTALSNEEAHIHLPDRGLFVAIPMTGPGRWRLIAAGVDLQPGDAAPDPTLGDLQGLANRFSASPMKLSNPTWLGRFRLHHRGVDRYRAGRAFLAGDAAHIHSPAGGQGMNTGIQDAYNLAWKLALVVHGDLPIHFLDSYHEERWPVGQALLKFTDRLFSLGATQSGVALAARRRFAPALLRFATSTAERRSALFHFISELSINYRRSHFVGEDFGDADWRHGPLAGDRAPDGPALDTAGQSTSLHQAMAGLPFHLLVFAGDQTTAQVEQQIGEPASKMVHQHVITKGIDSAPGSLRDPNGVLHHRYGVSHQATYLIRPDGYVAFRAPRVERAQVVAGIFRG